MALSFVATDGHRDDATRAFRYPAGEPAVVIDTDATATVAILQGAEPDDLVTLALWANEARRRGIRPSALIPYLPGSRADHRDRPGFDAEVYARLINLAGLAQVVCVDPHSSVMPALIDHLRIVGAADMVERHLDAGVRTALVGVIAPDDGARERAGQVAARLSLPLFQAHKHRDFATGELSGFSCDPLPDHGELLVVDDICDGGGTFVGLAEAVSGSARRLHLWVTHGVFSGHAARLADHFSTITTTDSHPGCTNLPGATVIPLLPTLLQELTRDEAHP